MSTAPRPLTRLVIRVDPDLHTYLSAIAARLMVDTGDEWSHAAVIRGLIAIGQRVVATFPEYGSLKGIFQGAYVKRGKKPSNWDPPPLQVPPDSYYAGNIRPISEDEVKQPGSPDSERNWRKRL